MSCQHNTAHLLDYLEASLGLPPDVTQLIWSSMTIAVRNRYIRETVFNEYTQFAVENAKLPSELASHVIYNLDQEYFLVLVHMEHGSLCYGVEIDTETGDYLERVKK